MEMVKGILLALNQKVLGIDLNKIKIAYWLLIISAYMSMNCIDFFHNDVVCTRIFCSLLALGFILNAWCDKNLEKYKWFFKSIFVLSIYNLIDEFIGRACKADVWEPIFAIITFYYYYRKRNL